jgi:hypothetical protein
MAKFQSNKSEKALKTFGYILFKVFHIILKLILRRRIFAFISPRKERELKDLNAEVKVRVCVT